MSPRHDLSDGAEARAWLGGYADRLLGAVRPYASPSGSLITLPGRPGGYGTAVDGLEGFARTFLLAGFRLAGERGADPTDLAGRYAAGLAAGTDPGHPERWVRPEEHGQAKVEAASLALILDLTREWIWDRLDPAVQERTVAYLSSVVGDAGYPHNNWVWFRIVVETFLRSVGGPWSAADLERDLAVHDSFVRADGWFSDGDERSYDHYAGWALHLYPALWAWMRGADEAFAPLPADSQLPADSLLPADGVVGSPAGAASVPRTRAERDVAHLDRYLQDTVRLVGGDGSPLLQGRSLVYRFAAAGPYWAGAVSGVPSVAPGLLREAAVRTVAHFADHGVPGGDGLLTLGWHHEWRPLAQRYSGTGSPYWAAKGLLGLALPADHPVWTAPAEPLPVDTGDVLAVAVAPGWAISGTRSDGVVRVVNHGTDHAFAGDATGDSPLYARLGYSTATSPLLDAAAWTDPVDQSVVLLDAEGRATHRAGFRTLSCELVPGSAPDKGSVPHEGSAAHEGLAPHKHPGSNSAGGAAAVLASTAQAHWLDADLAAPDHGSGRPGTARPAGTVTTVSVVRGAWEVRLVRITDPSPAAVGVRLGGWAVSGAAVRTRTEVSDGDGRAPAPGSAAATATARASDGRVVVSRVAALGGLPAGLDQAGVTLSPDASPLGEHSGTPWLGSQSVPVGVWLGAAVGLAVVPSAAEPAAPDEGAADPVGEAPPTAVVASGHVHVTWSDGESTTAPLP